MPTADTGSRRTQFINIPIHRCLQLLGGHDRSIRLEILIQLADGPRDVSTIARALELDVKTVSHHLRVLKHHSLVDARRETQRRIYALDDAVHATSNADSCLIEIRTTQGQVSVDANLDGESHSV